MSRRARRTRQATIEALPSIDINIKACRTDGTILNYTPSELGIKRKYRKLPTTKQLDELRIAALCSVKCIEFFRWKGGSVKVEVK